MRARRARARERLFGLGFYPGALCDAAAASTNAAGGWGRGVGVTQRRVGVGREGGRWRAGGRAGRPDAQIRGRAGERARG